MGAVFVDLDRTLLRGPSEPGAGPRPASPGCGAPRPDAPRGRRALRPLRPSRREPGVDGPGPGGGGAGRGLAPGRGPGGGRGERCPSWPRLVAPFAPAVLHGHRAAGRRLVLATTTPVDMVTPLAQALGFDDVVATRYAVTRRSLHRAHRGVVRLGPGQARSRPAVGGHRRRGPGRLPRLLGQRSTTCRSFRASAIPTRSTPIRGSTRWRWPGGGRSSTGTGPPGCPRSSGSSPTTSLRLVVRRSTFPYARFDIRGVETIPQVGGVILAVQPPQLLRRGGPRPRGPRARPAGPLPGQARAVRLRPVVGWVLRAIGGHPGRPGQRVAGTRCEAAEASLRAGEVVVDPAGGDDPPRRGALRPGPARPHRGRPAWPPPPAPRSSRSASGAPSGSGRGSRRSPTSSGSTTSRSGWGRRSPSAWTTRSPTPRRIMAAIAALLPEDERPAARRRRPRLAATHPDRGA